MGAAASAVVMGASKLDAMGGLDKKHKAVIEAMQASATIIVALVRTRLFWIVTLSEARHRHGRSVPASNARVPATQCRLITTTITGDSWLREQRGFLFGAAS